MASFLNVENLAIGYGSRTVATGLTFLVESGQSVLVVGQNGSGKSTLVKTLAGLISPLGGGGQFLGDDINTLTPRKVVLAGGRYLAQEPRCFPDLTVRQSLGLLSRLHGLPDNEKFRYGGERALRSLSVGQRKIVALEMVLAGRPKVVILDEPTSSLDHATAMELLCLVGEARRNGVDFIVVEHAFKDFLAICDKALVVQDGRMSFFGDSALIERSQDAVSSVRGRM